MWGRSQHEIDVEYGRSEYEKRAEHFRYWKQEKCMSGTAHGDSELLQLARQFITQAQAARACGERLADLLGDGFDPVVVRLGGDHYSLTKASSTYALPVFVRTVKVLGDTP